MRKIIGTKLPVSEQSLPGAHKGVRISKETHAILSRICKERGVTQTRMVDFLVKEMARVHESEVETPPQGG